MSMFPHTVTVYNVEQTTDPATLDDVTVNHITVLRGVLLDASKAANVRDSGLEGADAADLYIPLDVESIDGSEIEIDKPKRKQYIGPVDFWRLEDKSGFWTLTDSGNTFFVKGEVVEPHMDQMGIEMAFDDVYRVTKVDMKDFGGLAHFEVGGN